MISATETATRNPTHTTPTVCVDASRRGDWDIVLPDEPVPLTRHTLVEAERVAQMYAEERRPCEVVVRDAYDRVLHHELVAP